MSEEKLKERLCGKCQTWFPQRSAWDEWCDACDLKDEQRCRCDEIISCDSCGGVALCSFCKDNPPEKVEMIPRAWWERLKLRVASKNFYMRGFDVVKLMDRIEKGE